ncbi:cupin domain-containing protein [Lysobacter sp. A6]|uniref:Cupin domain-containing protein n=1 Tax=Noviluteimonas lactosilytica TaxID=2888523 RepID=A0ABS8JLN9_9GAMM|nr:cupin domain-containing protein [Lysobacter lactosilyticus]MCC8364482.1 cupin domain-containing protein [Lysobacter lactosilyticus]
MFPIKTVLALLILATGSLSASDAALQRRLSPEEIDRLASSSGGAGTSGLPAVTTTVLYGDPAKAGLYSIQLRVAPDTVIQAHTHKDARTATVVSGTWYFGYGKKSVPEAVRKLPAGSFYTEPAGDPHFARTGSDGAVLLITGYGPTDTKYLK